MVEYFKGDDLIDVITVNMPKGAELLDITKAEVQVGNLEPFVNENPTFPYTISIRRNLSTKLNFSNPIYLRIYYLIDNNEEVRQTCIGSLNLKTLDQVVRDS